MNNLENMFFSITVLFSDPVFYKNPLFYIVLIVAFIVIILIILIVLLFTPEKKKKPIYFENNKIFRYLENFNLHNDQKHIVQAIIKETKASYLEFLHNHSVFENAIKKFLSIPKNHHLKNINILHNIRKLLAFTIDNQQIDFLCTQQLINGCFIEIKILDKDYKISYRSQVLSITEGYFVVELLNYEGTQYFINPDSKILLNFFIHSDTYVAHSVVLKTVEEPQTGLAIQHTNTIKKIEAHIQ